MFKLTLLLLVPSVAANVCLQGMGSFSIENLITQVGPLYQSYMAKYGKNVEFKYKTTTSGSGFENLKLYSNLSNACPSVFSETDLLNEVSDDNYKVFPLFSQALVIIYNLQDPTPLNLSLQSVADIYLGYRQDWNDTLIDDILNPTMDLPSETIHPVAQAEYSSSTYQFTHLLATNDETWRFDYGDFYYPNFTNAYCCESNNWPPTVRYFGQTITGMVGLVSSIPYSIGYATLGSLTGFNVRQAVLITGYNYTATYPDPISVQKTIFYMYNKSDPPSLILNMSLDDDIFFTYPLVALNYFSLNLSYDNIDCSIIQELTGFLHWFLFVMNPQVLLSLKYVPLIKPMALQIQAEVIEKITCKGQYMYKSYVDSLNTFPKLGLWTIVAICLACTVTISGISVAFYVIYRKVKRLNVSVPYEMRF